MDAALLITQPFTESGGEAMFVAGFFPFIFLIFFLFQIHRLRRRGNVPCFRKFFIFRCASIFWSFDNSIFDNILGISLAYFEYILGGEARFVAFLDALASLYLKLSVSEWVIYRFQRAHLQVFQSYFFLFLVFVLFYRFPDWVPLDGVQWISLSIWCCVMNECRLLHENPFTTGKWYYYE